MRHEMPPVELGPRPRRRVRQKAGQPHPFAASLRPPRAPPDGNHAVVAGHSPRAGALLHRLGHQPTIAANGAAAVESYLAAASAGMPYDLVLMDVHMPDVDGLEATRQIRAAEAGTRRTPIVALTANAYGEDREACVASGMDDFLVKPLDRERLAAVLASAGRPATLAA